MIQATAHFRGLFRFSLGTMLLAVTAIGLFLGGTNHLVRQREELLTTIQAAGGNWGTTATPRRSLPLAWRLLDAEHHDVVWVPTKLYADEAFQRRAAWLLPEADLVELTPDSFRELLLTNLENYDRSMLEALLVNLPDDPELRQSLAELDVADLRAVIQDNPDFLGSNFRQ